MKKLKHNPNLFVSPERLAIRNLPLELSVGFFFFFLYYLLLFSDLLTPLFFSQEKDLKATFLEAVVKKAKEFEVSKENEG